MPCMYIHAECIHIHVHTHTDIHTNPMYVIVGFIESLLNQVQHRTACSQHVHVHIHKNFAYFTSDTSFMRSYS